MERYMGTFVRWLLTPVGLFILGLGLYYLMRLFRWEKQQATGLALISPWLFGFLGFTAIPIFYSLYLSFTDFSLFGKEKWVGLGNFIKLFTNDVEFWPSVRITLSYAIFTLPVGVFGSLLVALLINREIKGIRIFRTILYLTAILPDTAVAIIWRQLFNGETGLINFFLSLFGVNKIDWFGNPKYVLPAFVIISIWGIFGTNTIIFLASLKDVPRVLYEAAEIDGASGFRRFVHITIPQISSVILVQVVMSLIGSLQMFTVAQFLRPTTQAGLFMNQLVYTRGFTQLHMGEASAIAWVLFVIILVLTLLVFRTSPAWVHYETEVKDVKNAR
ncbi:MAG: sugar ABC transporter permease [Clostridiaceae bacterium]|nr:sugar ABC transporter permease [Clostridiaceae bacterium]